MILLAFLSGASFDPGCVCADPSHDSRRGSHLGDVGPPHQIASDPDAVAPNDSSGTGGTAAGGSGLVIAAAGDIACNGCAQGATADLLDGLVGSKRLAALLPLGDDAYQSGSLVEFERYYRPAWGRPELLAITRPVPGNHEYVDGAAAGYFDFFDGPGQATGIAGSRGSGYYSFDLAGWHLIALNSSDACGSVSCAEGSPQQQWLVADLASHPSLCTLAFWHHPRFQAGTTSGETVAAAPLWNVLYDAGVDVVLNGHEHGYQQLAPLDKSGAIDRAKGIRTFVVGTGGAEFDTSFGGPRADAVETTLAGTYGVLVLTLRPSSYEWQFVGVGNVAPPAAGGTAACH